MALLKHQHSLSTDSTDTDGQGRFSPLLQSTALSIALVDTDYEGLSITHIYLLSLFYHISPCFLFHLLYGFTQTVPKESCNMV